MNLINLKKELEDLKLTVKEVEVQVQLTKDKAYQTRAKRNTLMREDFSKHKEQIMKLDKEEKELWDSVRSLNDMKEDMEKELEQKSVEVVSKVMELRKQEIAKLREQADKKRMELVKKRFEYLQMLEKEVKTENSKVSQLEDIDQFILEYGNKDQQKEVNIEITLIDTMYGRLNNTPNHFVGNKDYTLLFHEESKQNLTYRLFKLTGEIEFDDNLAQRKLSEALKKKGSKK
jgi:uncharacterized protein YoxC